MRTRRFFRKIFGGNHRDELSELSTSSIHSAVLSAIAAAADKSHLSGEYLDVGAGTGELLRAVTSRHPLRAFACDYTNELVELADQKIDIVDLNHRKLPYEENRFALVTCVETIEHLENFRDVVREIYRVLKPGGIAVFTTPNILNLRSRLRYFSSGFYNLFGPLLPDEPNVFSTRGHINPVSWFYLSHALLSAGFRNLRLRIDKYQRRSFFAYPLVVLPIRAANSIVYWRDKNKYRTLDERNAWTVRAMNSRDLLLGRTLIVSASKPA